MCEKKEKEEQTCKSLRLGGWGDKGRKDLISGSGHCVCFGQYWVSGINTSELSVRGPCPSLAWLESPHHLAAF